MAYTPTYASTDIKDTIIDVVAGAFAVLAQVIEPLIWVAVGSLLFAMISRFVKF